MLLLYPFDHTRSSEWRTHYEELFTRYAVAHPRACVRYTDESLASLLNAVMTYDSVRLAA